MFVPGVIEELNVLLIITENFSFLEKDISVQIETNMCQNWNE